MDTPLWHNALPCSNPRMLGQAVKAKREALGLTQDTVARAAGVRRQTLVELEAGGNVRMRTLFATLAVLGKGLAVVDPQRLDLEHVHLLLDPPEE